MTSFYSALAGKSLAGQQLSVKEAEALLSDPSVALLPLLNAAFEVRRAHAGMDVTVHIINNAQNGHCPEDCGYCAQAKTSEADIEDYGLKPDAEVLLEAERAYKSGAHRYCMVFAGRGPSPRRVDRLCRLIRTIKDKYNLEVCVSAGLVSHDGARKLKEAGLDRLNHNLNTSENHYTNICSTHTYADRLNTLQAGRDNGLQLCSGMIVGMGESHRDIIDVALELRRVKAESIPVNFLVPIEGSALTSRSPLTPEFCLRVLCMFRFMNPEAELRVAAGRELHLRSMEVMALYPANSLFLDGYLNTRGSTRAKTLRMIKDAGFTIKSDIDLDDLLAKEETLPRPTDNESRTIMKDLGDLRPVMDPKSQTL